jgi:hypothetical protein
MDLRWTVVEKRMNLVDLYGLLAAQITGGLLGGFVEAFGGGGTAFDMVMESQLPGCVRIQNITTEKVVVAVVDSSGLMARLWWRGMKVVQTKGSGEGSAG